MGCLEIQFQGSFRLAVIFEVPSGAMGCAYLAGEAMYGSFKMTLKILSDNLSVFDRSVESPEASMEDILVLEYRYISSQRDDSGVAGPT